MRPDARDTAVALPAWARRARARWRYTGAERPVFAEPVPEAADGPRPEIGPFKGAAGSEGW